ncbi:MAG: hypothetical protein ACP5OG_00220 [Candidatus Nanoarchaeia archaeon]
MEKPKKQAYAKDVQNNIYNVARNVVKNIAKEHPHIYSANCFGSIIKRDLGVYDKVYDNKRYGSDIDIVCVVDPKFSAPKHWKYQGSAKAFDIYDVDAVENHIPQLGKKELPIHPIKFLIYNPKVHNYAEAKKWSAIDKQNSESKGLPVEEWYLDRKNFERVMKDKLDESQNKQSKNS